MLELYEEYKPKYMDNDKDPEGFSVHIRRGLPKATRDAMERNSGIYKQHKDNPDNIALDELNKATCDLIAQACLPKLSREIEVNVGCGVQKITTVAELLDVTGQDQILINELNAAIHQFTYLSALEIKNSDTPPGPDGTQAAGESAATAAPTIATEPADGDTLNESPDSAQ